MVSTLILSLLLGNVPPSTEAPKESDYYEITTVKIPDGVVLEVGGLVAPEPGVVYAGTRRGDIWRIENAYGSEPEFKLWADGLQEPLGLLWKDGWLYTSQRGELSRLRDNDGDGQSDELETICDTWTISGNYHEYCFGPRIDNEGNFWVTLNRPFGGEPFGAKDWRGWAMRISPEGEMVPYAGGLRSPAGIEISPWGDIFYSDNQGEWCGSNKLCHIEEGDFFGHPWGIESAKLPGSRMKFPGEMPDGLTYTEARKQLPDLKLPVIWFPYDKMGKSAAGMVWDTTEGNFGPFKGQLLVGDQHHSSIMRVDMEKVDGVWQGAAMRFRENFDCGVLRICWGDNDTLVVGETNRGWGSKGPKPWGIQMLRWTGEIPCEVLTCRATNDGYRLTFTTDMDTATLADPASYSIENYTYKLHSPYGSPEVDRGAVTVEEAIVEDNRTVRLRLAGPAAMRIGYVSEMKLMGIRAADGRGLLHPEVYATLNVIPGG